MIKAEHITSIKDPRIIEARALTSASQRTQLQKCLLEGAESIQWAIDEGLPVEHVFCSAEQARHELTLALQQRQIPCYIVTEGILKKISDTSYVIPFLGVLRTPAELETPEQMGDFILVLDRVKDHGNIGTIIRTASAFGIRDIVSTTPTLDMYYKKIVSASRGRVFASRLKRFDSGQQAIQALKEQGYQIIATSPHARDLQAMAPLQPKPIALVVGNETEGIAEDISKNADIIVQIPMSGYVESLNVGVATGISLYELKFRMVFTMLVNYIRTNLGREVNVTGKLIQQAFDAQIRHISNLSGQQAILLMILICDQSMSLEQVSRDTGTLADEREELLKPLLARGYIRYQDSNQNSIVPTEEGQRALAQLWTLIEQAEQATLADFSDDEKAQFNAYLKRIQANCKRLLQQQP
ncbi:hypothetical protein EPA93_38440 [Ktedonosporobacter rubrisoli]|uniref:Uncharacterized protein n=1 Tax=Ktedonosporobacter rubrisoli TaxID=2509675 RepID=A0A4P6K237_KTERU|nr:TrmH family RNA methyltransferase [Ktedonosporobacter rubrisoli]QBD81536.1 hypothetical protein EPA93_38440 [Ktedonosporobacter rubrisoli]